MGAGRRAGEGFGFLSDLMVDGEGHVHVAQRGTDQPVLVFDRDGRQIGAWGEGTLAEPHYINASADGGILVADRDAHQVLRFDKDGKVVQALGKRHWPSLDAPFNHPTAAAQAPDGEIYVADGYGNSSVHRFAADGSLIRTWGGQGSGPGAFTTPHAIAVDSRGRVLVADRENNRVQVFDREGNFVAEWGDFYHPMQIWIDDRDLVFVTDQIPRISLLTLDGRAGRPLPRRDQRRARPERRRRRQPLSLRAAAAGSDQARAAQLKPAFLPFADPEGGVASAATEGS